MIQARRLWANLLTTCQAILDHVSKPDRRVVSPADLLARVKAAVPRQKSHLEALQLLAEYKTEIKSELAQENLFQQLTNVLQAIAARQPLLLLLDALQWADVTSISLLFHLGRRLKGSRIMILGAYRRDEVAVGRGSQRVAKPEVLGLGRWMPGPILPVSPGFRAS